MPNGLWVAQRFPGNSAHFALAGVVRRRELLLGSNKLKGNRVEATERTSFSRVTSGSPFSIFSKTESFKRLLKRRNTKSFKHRLLDKNIRQVYFSCGFFSKNHFGYSGCKPSLVGDIKTKNIAKNIAFLGCLKLEQVVFFDKCMGGKSHKTPAKFPRNEVVDIQEVQLFSSKG